MTLKEVFSGIFKAFIRAYSTLISPLLGRSCRFEPTCSHYAHEAIDRHGPWAGLYLTISRILRCHPWSKAHWYDPVPERFTAPSLMRYKRRNAPTCDGRCKTEKTTNSITDQDKTSL